MNMTVKDILNSVKNWFDWTPVMVSEPVEVYCDYLDKGHVLLGYEVNQNVGLRYCRGSRIC